MFFSLNYHLPNTLASFCLIYSTIFFLFLQSNFWCWNTVPNSSDFSPSDRHFFFVWWWHVEGGPADRRRADGGSSCATASEKVGTHKNLRHLILMGWHGYEDLSAQTTRHPLTSFCLIPALTPQSFWIAFKIQKISNNISNRVTRLLCTAAHESSFFLFPGSVRCPVWFGSVQTISWLDNHMPTGTSRVRVD